MFKTMKAARIEARRLRAEGKVVKIFEHSNVYTQPGRGIAVSIEYEVRVVS